MLFQLGSVIFEIAPLNPQDTTRTTEAGVVDKPVLGRRPPLEFVGDGPETFQINAVLYPATLGGLGNLGDLDAIRKSGIPQFLMRGDGSPLGWFLLIGVTEKSTYLGANGIGKVINVEINLRRSDAPTGDDFFATVFGMVE